MYLCKICDFFIKLPFLLDRQWLVESLPASVQYCISIMIYVFFHILVSLIIICEIPWRNIIKSVKNIKKEGHNK